MRGRVVAVDGRVGPHVRERGGDDCGIRRDRALVAWCAGGAVGRRRSRRHPSQPGVVHDVRCADGGPLVGGGRRIRRRGAPDRHRPSDGGGGGPVDRAAMPNGRRARPGRLAPRTDSREPGDGLLRKCECSGRSADGERADRDRRHPVGVPRDGDVGVAVHDLGVAARPVRRRRPALRCRVPPHRASARWRMVSAASPSDAARSSFSWSSPLSTSSSVRST